MVREFVIRNKLMNEELDVISVKCKNYCKVIVTGENSGIQFVKKIKNFDDLLKQYMELAIKTAYLEKKLRKEIINEIWLL